MSDVGYEMRQGDVMERLREMPDTSIQCCVTSPPYWGLRDYGVEGQLGLEKTPAEFVERMVEVFEEVRRVLRVDGTFWMNIGDSYATEGGRGEARMVELGNPSENAMTEPRARGHASGTKAAPGLKTKDLCLIPERLILALQDAGWWVRSRIAWVKGSAMPESVRDRPTSAWEHIWLLTKASKYFCDMEAVRTPQSSTSHGGGKPGPHRQMAMSGRHDGNPAMGILNGGANLRNWWKINSENFPEAHFATYPSEIPRRCILMGTSAKGCCPECGAPWERVVERTAMEIDRSGNHPEELRTRTSGQMTKPPTSTTTGWRPTCGHDGDPVPCTVLDPFAGSGTTLMVAEQLGRDSIGIELNPEYIEIAHRRIQQGLSITRKRKPPKNSDVFTLEAT
jgi:DNA modification methylase